MEFNRGYKYRLKTTGRQKQLLFNQIFAYNQTWNILLNQKMQEYEDNLKIADKSDKKYISAVEQDNLVKGILRNRQLKFNTKVTQQCRTVFNKDFKKTIKSLGQSSVGMLKFKSSKNFNNQGFQTTKEQYKIKSLNSKFKILRLFGEDLKIRWSRDFPENSEAKTVTITYTDNEFYASFNVVLEAQKNDMSLKKITPATELNSYAMDMNINSLDMGDRSVHNVIDLSFIKKSDMNKKHRKKIKKLQRKQSRRVLKSKQKKTRLGKNFKKTQNKINRIYKKNSDKKAYNLHAVVNKITKKLKEERINHLVIEELNIKEMTSKKNVNPLLGKSKSKEMKKNMLQASFHSFKQILQYKCAYNEIYLETVNPANTSRTCNNCGNIKTMELKDREYECGECGYENNRDYNAVLNILDKSEYAIPKTVKIDSCKVRIEPASLSL